MICFAFVLFAADEASGAIHLSDVSKYSATFCNMAKVETESVSSRISNVCRFFKRKFSIFHVEEKTTRKLKIAAWEN